MRKVIASLVAGFILGTTATAGAVVSAYWEGDGNRYHCDGVTSGVICIDRKGGYQIGMTKGYVYLAYGKNNLAACERTKRPLQGCFSDGHVFSGP